MNKRSIPIAVDFDGTIVEHKYPYIGAPVPEAIEWLHKFKVERASLFLWTMRSNVSPYNFSLQEAVDYCASKNLFFDGINENPTQKEWTLSPKCYAKIYIDDAAFGVPLVHVENERPYVDWTIVGPQVMEQIHEWNKRFN